jgi:hypothetical protein
MPIDSAPTTAHRRVHLSTKVLRALRVSFHSQHHPMSASTPTANTLGPPCLDYDVLYRILQHLLSDPTPVSLARTSLVSWAWNEPSSRVLYRCPTVPDNNNYAASLAKLERTLKDNPRLAEKVRLVVFSVKGRSAVGRPGAEALEELLRLCRKTEEVELQGTLRAPLTGAFSNQPDPTGVTNVALRQCLDAITLHLPATLHTLSITPHDLSDPFAATTLSASYLSRRLALLPNLRHLSLSRFSSGVDTEWSIPKYRLTSLSLHDCALLQADFLSILSPASTSSLRTLHLKLKFRASTQAPTALRAMTTAELAHTLQRTVASTLSTLHLVDEPSSPPSSPHYLPLSLFPVLVKFTFEGNHGAHFPYMEDLPSSMRSLTIISPHVREEGFIECLRGMVAKTRGLTVKYGTGASCGGELHTDLIVA